MSHCIEETDSTMFIGQPAWHGLGTVLGDDAEERTNLDLALKTSGLDWEVGLMPMMTPDEGEYPRGDETINVPHYMAGKQVPDRWSLYRNDTKAIISTVGNDYDCLQNREHFKFFEPFVESGACKIETCGSLKGGRVIWVLAVLDRDDATVKGEDRIRKYMLFTSSHDMSMASQIGFSPTRVVCMNTLAWAIEESASKLLKVKHTKQQRTSIAMVQDIVNTADADFEATAQQYRLLAECAIDKQGIEDYVRMVFGAPTKQDVFDAMKNEGENIEISTRMANICERCTEFAIGGLGNSGETLWDGYNGITQYLTHEKGMPKDMSDLDKVKAKAETKLFSNWFDHGKSGAAGINDRALTIALDMVPA